MINNANEPVTTVEIVKRATSVFGNGRGTLLLAGVGVSISLASSFMFCLVSIGFDFTQLADTVFWSRWMSMSISTLFAYVLVVLHKDEMNRKSKWYEESMNELSEMSKKAGNDFDRYLTQLNLQRRIDWYKRNVNIKIGNLNQKLLKLELAGKPTEKIKGVIEKYRLLITDEYLEANKYTLKTKSKPFSAAQILSETQKGDDGEVNFRSVAAYYGGKTVMKLCFSLCLTAAFACVVVQSFDVGVSVAAIAMTIFTVLSLLISVVSAIMAANGCYRNIYVPNLQLKLKILSGFEKWNEENKK